MSGLKAKLDLSLIVVGILLIICSCVIIVFPNLALVTIAAFTGAAFLASGIGDIISFIRLRNANNASIWTLGYAAIDVIIGIVMLVHPVATAEVVPWLVALCFGILGVFEIVTSIVIRKIVSSWTWTLVSGIVCVAGAVMLFMFPVFLAPMLAIVAAVRGVGMIVCGFVAGRYE